MPARQEEEEIGKSAATDTTSQKISVTVISQDGNEVFFKISRFTQLKKLITSYCERQALNIDSVAFLFDDCFLRREHTPNEVGMDEGDKIYTFYAKSLKRDKKGKPCFSEGKAPPQAEMEKHRDDRHRANENPDAYTFDELAKRTTQTFEQAMSLLMASFNKSNHLTENAQKYMEEAQTKMKTSKRDLDAKLVSEKKVAEKDLMIEKMRNELREAKDAISHLTAELSKFKKDLVKPVETVQSIRKERWDSKRVSVSGSQSQRKKSRLHDPIPVQQPLIEQGNSKDVEQSRISDEDEDKMSNGGLQQILINVKAETGESVFFKIRQTTRLGKVMRAYCNRQGEKDYDALCFAVHGKIQRDDTTPYELQLKDGDVLQAVRKSSNL